MSRLRFGILILCCAGAVFAQKDTGAIVGTVLDASGASVPGAQVSAVNAATNFAYHAVTDTTGQYVMSPVRVGAYRLSVKASGFKTEVVESLTLEVQQRARLDFTLQPGEVREMVEVTGRAPVLETDNSERGQVINSQYMQGLPLNGRNPVQLAQLTAGVVFSEPGARDEQGYGFSANGARSLQNNFLLEQNSNNATSFGTPSFGYVTAARAPRQVQFALKFYY